MSGNPIPRIPNAPRDYNQSSTQQILSIIQTALEELRRRGVAHEQSDDPHPQYTTQTEVDASVTAHETTYDHNAYDSHVASTSNPHSVTAAQVGADPSGTAATEVATHEAAADPHTQYAELAGGASADFTAMPLVGGDPIVEEGSNANGTYTKWASGKLICENSGFVIDYSTASILSATWTFPEPFVDTEISANINLRNIYGEISNNASNHAIDCVASITTTSCLPQTRCNNSGYLSGDSITVDVIAIGRWK